MGHAVVLDRDGGTDGERDAVRQLVRQHETECPCHPLQVAATDNNAALLRHKEPKLKASMCTSGDAAEKIRLENDSEAYITSESSR